MARIKPKKRLIFRILSSFESKQLDERLSKPIPGESAVMVRQEILLSYPYWVNALKIQDIECLGQQFVSPDIDPIVGNLKFHVDNVEHLVAGVVIEEGDFGYEHCRRTILEPESPFPE